MHKLTTIIWDWNGTLLDDVEVCVESINILLNKRNLPAIDLARYREVFTFPVRDYYELIGFDFTKEPYDKVAFEFIDVYLDKLNEAPIYNMVIPLLTHFRQMGFRQVVLSAMEQENLEKSIVSKGLGEFFSMIVGNGDHFANGKSGNAKRIMETSGVSPSGTVLIGDTLHDHEVASIAGCECILVAAGHQSMERLKTSNRMVVENLESERIWNLESGIWNILTL